MLLSMLSIPTIFSEKRQMEMGRKTTSLKTSISMVLLNLTVSMRTKDCLSQQFRIRRVKIQVRFLRRRLAT